MALLKCPECTRQVSSEALSCPNCGYPVSQRPAYSYLQKAASDGKENLVRKIIANGIDVDIRDPNNNDTALIVAAFWGRENMVKVLLSLGANINAQTQDGYTPMYWALYKNHRGVVSILIENKANLYIKTDTGLTLLHCAAKYGDLGVLDTGPIDLLIAAGVDVNIRDDYGETPLHNAVWQIYDARAKYLLNHGADVNAKNNNGETPLATARLFGSKKMMKLLREFGGVE